MERKGLVGGKTFANDQNRIMLPVVGDLSVVGQVLPGPV